MTELWFLTSLKNAASLIKSLLSAAIAHYVQLSSATSLEIVAKGEENLSASAVS